MFWEERLLLAHPEDVMTSPRLNDPGLQDAFLRGKEWSQANPRDRAAQSAVDNAWIVATAEKQSGKSHQINSRGIRDPAYARAEEDLTAMWTAGKEFGEFEKKYGPERAIQEKIKNTGVL